MSERTSSLSSKGFSKPQTGTPEEQGWELYISTRRTNLPEDPGPLVRVMGAGMSVVKVSNKRYCECWKALWLMSREVASTVLLLRMGQAVRVTWPELETGLHRLQRGGGKAVAGRPQPAQNPRRTKWTPQMSYSLYQARLWVLTILSRVVSRKV